jgi:long-subunit fatty acid transport protein
LLYEIDEGTRIGLTWNSQVNLDFKGPAKFSRPVAGCRQRALNKAGLLDSTMKVGITVPQQAMAQRVHAARPAVGGCSAASAGSSGRGSERSTSASTTRRTRSA